MKIKTSNINEIIDMEAKDNQWFELVSNKDERLNFSCCDCGLSHIVRAKIEEGKIFVSFEKDNPITERNRQARKYNFHQLKND